MDNKEHFQLVNVCECGDTYEIAQTNSKFSRYTEYHIWRPGSENVTRKYPYIIPAYLLPSQGKM